MLQISLAEPGRFVAATVPEPVATPGHALVRIRRIGVCGTDLHAFAGRQPFFQYPRVLGHELGVEVVELPAGSHSVKVGDRCAVEPYLNCGRCHSCTRGKPNCCERLQVLGVHTDGGMCEHFAVPVERLFPSAKLGLDQLALVETLSIGQHAVERAQIVKGQDVLVVGAGPIGLAVVQFAIAQGGNVTVMEPNEGRREFVERFGAKAVADVESRLYEVVFDATGNVAAMEKSFERVNFGGKLVFVGLVQNRISFDDPLFHRREMTVMSSRNSANAFPAIMADIEAGRIDTTPWITHRLSLAEVPAGFPNLPRQPGLIKAMIEVD
jgi:2-desacetyl-2-hydroxyethyl bacteriochlorophyllide A dehydrogenase